MVEISPSDGGSLVLDRPSRLWSAFSGAAFRRKLLDTMRCGVSRHRSSVNTSASHGEKDSKKNAAKKGSERLSELLRLEVSETALDELEVERKTQILNEFQNVVKRLQSGEEKKVLQRQAAIDVRRLAKDDSEARTTLAMLGAIPPLVGMLDYEEADFLTASLYALLNLAIGNDLFCRNKAAIVKAGAVHKMLNLLKTPNQSVSEAIVANFLGLSALDSNKPIIGSSGAVAFLVTMLQTGSSQPKQDALRALFNLSISHSNIIHIVETSVVPLLFTMLGNMEVSEKILSILCNLTSTHDGRKAIGQTNEAFQILIDVLNWSDAPECQEKATYVLMVMSHKSWSDKQAMIEAGMVSSLLELTLLGSTLAQRRASRILESLRMDKGKQVSVCSASVSAPLQGSYVKMGDLREELGEEAMSEERRAVNQLVQQSLQNNMTRIVKRANLPQDFDPSDHFKSLTASSISKSLPF